MPKKIIDNDVPADALIYGPLPSEEAAHELHRVMSDLKQFDSYGRIAETETGWVCWISPKRLVKYTLGGNQVSNDEAKLELSQVTRAFLSGWNLALKPIREAEELCRCSVVWARTVATNGHAALAEDGAALADRVAEAALGDVRVGDVRVDFSDVRSVNSVFSNSFFLRLVEIDPTQVLARRVRFSGTSSFQDRVLKISRRAVLRSSR